MKVHKYICDRCKKEVETKSNYKPNDWVEITFEASVQYRKKYYKYDFCPDCAKTLNVEGPITETQQVSIGERLVAIIEEIAVPE